MADETALIQEANQRLTEEVSLIKKPYLDRLAIVQHQKDIERKEARETKKRIKVEKNLARKAKYPHWQIELFLRTKFPDAFSPDEISSLSPKEFKEILARSRNWLLRKAAVYYSGFLVSAGSIAGALNIMMSGDPPNIIFGIFVGMFFIGGLFGLFFSSTLSFFVTKILLEQGNQVKSISLL